MSIGDPIGNRTTTTATTRAMEYRNIIAANEEYTPLTMDNVLAYCAKRLREMDKGIQDKMDNQNTFNALSQACGDIKGVLQNEGKNGSGETAFKDGNIIANANGALDRAITLARESGNMGVAQNLEDVKIKLNAGPPGDVTVGNDELAAMNTLLDHAAGTAHTSAENGMIEIQALMGKRATIIQMSTGMMNGINESLKAVAGNIGR